MNGKNEVRFASGRDLKLWLTVWGFIILITILMAINRVYPVVILMLLLIIFIGWLFFGTEYRIGQGKLLISNGPFRYTIPLSEIKEIRSTRNPASSPANSMDRLEVAYGQYKKIMISPANKANFIKIIQQHAPQITLSDELKKHCQ